MQDIAAGTSGRKGWWRPAATALPTPADRLHELARQVERLATHGRLDPEAVCVAKFTIAGKMRELARAIRQ
jgi:hypothetical protein